MSEITTFFGLAFAANLAFGLAMGKKYCESKEFAVSELKSKAQLVRVQDKNFLAVTTNQGRVFGMDLDADTVIELKAGTVGLDAPQVAFLRRMLAEQVGKAAFVGWGLPSATAVMKSAVNWNFVDELIPKRQQAFGIALGTVTGLSVGYWIGSHLSILRNQELLDEEFFGNTNFWRKWALQIGASAWSRRRPTDMPASLEQSFNGFVGRRKTPIAFSNRSIRLSGDDLQLAGLIVNHPHQEGSRGTFGGWIWLGLATALVGMIGLALFLGRKTWQTVLERQKVRKALVR